MVGLRAGRFDQSQKPRFKRVPYRFVWSKMVLEVLWALTCSLF